MKIIIVKPYGMCKGVRRAIKLAHFSLAKFNKVFSLGELIHNEWVVGKLRKEGIRFVDSLNEIELNRKNAFIIRSHGMEPQLRNSLKNITIVDATCPIVKNIQKLCLELSKKNFNILVFGDKNHAEVKALQGYCYKRGVKIISSKEGIGKLKVDENTVLLSQSTKIFDDLLKIRDELIKKGLLSANFYNTICRDIQDRQKKLKKVAKRVKAMVIIGGRQSANTHNLYEIAKENCMNSCFISLPKEVNKINFDKIESLGITTGASTPDEFVLDVVRFIKKKINTVEIVEY
jgi:4-hydroxy-3-methylbut-2-enyl diphosphate reductase